MKTFQKDFLTVCCYDSRAEMGRAAAADVAAKIRNCWQKRRPSA